MAITWPPLQSSYCKLEALNLTMPLLSGADVRSYHTSEDAIYATAMFLMQKLSVDARFAIAPVPSIELGQERTRFSVYFYIL